MRMPPFPQMKKHSISFLASDKLSISGPGDEKTSLSYDANGNLLSETTGSKEIKYAWDGDNQLVTVTSPDAGTEHNIYDLSGKRVKRIAPTSITSYVYDDRNVLQEIDTHGVTVAQYTSSFGHWGGLISQRRGRDSSFYGFDLSANTRLLIDSSGQTHATYLYDAFGINRGSSLNDGNPHRYGGQYGYWCDGADRFYVGARHYDSSKGRWLSNDPIGHAGGDWNLYRYVGNGPIMQVDASGLQAIPIGIGGAALCALVPGCAELVAAGLIIAALALIAAYIAAHTKVCPITVAPCPPCPASTVQVHNDGKPHWPCTGAHWHCLFQNQNPVTCVCYGARRFGGCIPPPAPTTC